MECKLGILLPRSDTYPALGLEIINGLKLAINKIGDGSIQPNFIIESVGTATEDSLLKLAEKLVLQENIDLAISFCGDFRLTELIQIFNGYRKPLIHLDLGGRVLKKEHVSDYVLHHTLNICHTSFIAGEYAANHLGKKVLIMSSTYDGGYQFGDCFLKGFTASGGEVGGFHVSPMEYRSLDFSEVISNVEEIKPDVIFASFSYNEGKKIFEEFANSSLNGKIPIIAVPTMVDESIHTENYQIKNVQSITSWSFADETDAMIGFKNDYKEAYQQLPNLMALLGYEAGIILVACINSNGRIDNNLKDQVAHKTIETPRGNIRFNSYNESQVEAYKLTDFVYNETSYINRVVKNIEYSNSEHLYEACEAQPYTGWQNPYMCT